MRSEGYCTWFVCVCVCLSPLILALQGPSRCHKKIGTPIFRHPRSTNPRIYGTPIPIFLGLRDPTRDLPPENWNPRERTTVPECMLSRNASPYQECSQECFTVPKRVFQVRYKAVVSRWYIIQRIKDGAKVSQRCRGERLGGAHLWREIAWGCQISCDTGLSP